MNLAEEDIELLTAARQATLATTRSDGSVRLLPICYAVDRNAAAGTLTLYSAIDEKPKRVARLDDLGRVRDIRVRPAVTVMVDRWDEDWRRLAWVMLRGRAEILHDGAEHDAAQRRLRERYPQYRAMDLAPLPVIALRIARATSWGDLAGGDLEE